MAKKKEENLKAEESVQKEPAQPVQEAEEKPEPSEEKAEAKQEQAELEELRTKAGKLEEELKAVREQHLRTLAEYDNFRKRTEREKAGIYNDATIAAVSALLPVADNMDRALEQKDCSAEDLRRGVEMVCKQLQDSLKKLGVEEMAGVGEEFNPDLHNAVSHVENEALEENVISAVFQKGYLLGDKVVRHAMVQVAN